MTLRPYPSCCFFEQETNKWKFLCLPKSLFNEDAWVFLVEQCRHALTGLEDVKKEDPSKYKALKPWNEEENEEGSRKAYDAVEKEIIRIS